MTDASRATKIDGRTEPCAPPTSQHLRLVTRCRSRDELVALYGPYTTTDSIVLRISAPELDGTEQRFSIVLEDGSGGMSGRALLSSIEETSLDGQKVHGLMLKILELDEDSRQLHRDLLAAQCAESPMDLAEARLGSGATAEAGEKVTVEGHEEGDTELAQATELPEQARPAQQAEILVASDEPQTTEGTDANEDDNEVEGTTYKESPEVETLALRSGPVRPKLRAAHTPAPEMIPRKAQVPTMPALQPTLAPTAPAQRKTPPPNAPATTSAKSSPVGDASTRGRRLDSRQLFFAMAISAPLMMTAGLLVGYAVWRTPAADAARSAATATDKCASTPAPASLAATPKRLSPTMPQTNASPAQGTPVATPLPTTVRAPAVAAAVTTTCRATITSRPAGANVEWNDRAIGSTPLDDVEVPCGPAVVTWRRRGFKKATDKVSARSEESLRVARKLAPQFRKLILTSEPPGAKLSINGRSIGVAPTSTYVPSHQSVRVKATMPGFRSWSRNVWVTRTKKKVHASLKRRRSKWSWR